MQQVAIVLDVNEVNALLSVLGDLPIKTGLAALTGKILAQANDQMAAANAPKEVPKAEESPKE